MALRWYRRDEYVDPAVGKVSQLVPDASGLQHPLPGSLMGHGVCSSSQLCRNGPTAPGPIFVCTCPHGAFPPPAKGPLSLEAYEWAGDLRCRQAGA